MKHYLVLPLFAILCLMTTYTSFCAKDYANGKSISWDSRFSRSNAWRPLSRWSE